LLTLEIDAQRIQHTCAAFRRNQRRIVAIPMRYQREQARARAVVVTLQRAAAIERTGRADACQQDRQRQIARDFSPIAVTRRHADDERRMRTGRDALVVEEEFVDNRRGRVIGLLPDQLRIRDAVAERGFAYLDFVQRLLQAVQVVAPLPLDIARDDRCHPETASDQDKDGDDDTATEHRNALIATKGLKRALRHGAATIASTAGTTPFRHSQSFWKTLGIM